MDTTIIREVSFNYRGGERLAETQRQPEEVAAAFRRILPDNSREHVMALNLNGAHKVIAYSVVSYERSWLKQPGSLFGRIVDYGVIIRNLRPAPGIKKSRGLTPRRGAFSLT